MGQLNEKIRSFSFWILDRIRGGSLKYHYENVKHILENSDAKVVESHQQNALTALLQYAKQYVPYYSNISSDSINGFPVVNKSIIKDNKDLFISGNRQYKEYRSVVTSGSTGTPFAVKFDKGKSYRNTAETIYFNELAGLRLGQRLYYFRIWNELNKKNKLKKIFQNVVECDVSKLTDDYFHSLLDQIIKDHSEIGLLAYASVYDAMGAFLKKQKGGPVNARISAIIAMSEAISQEASKHISQKFETAVVSRYSNMENGFIAQQLKDKSDHYLINDASFFIEVLDLESDNSVPPGEPGRIIITDLFNYCMPLIRYDTGDVGILDEVKTLNRIRTVFKTIEGRKTDQIYDTAGNLVSCHVITNTMWKYNEISQFQFVQDSKKEYKFILNLNSEFARKNELINEIKQYLGNDANIIIEYVDEVPVLASGKRRKIINNYK